MNQPPLPSPHSKVVRLDGRESRAGWREAIGPYCNVCIWRSNFIKVVHIVCYSRHMRNPWCLHSFSSASVLSLLGATDADPRAISSGRTVASGTPGNAITSPDH